MEPSETRIAREMAATGANRDDAILAIHAKRAEMLRRFRAGEMFGADRGVGTRLVPISEILTPGQIEAAGGGIRPQPVYGICPMERIGANRWAA